MNKQSCEEIEAKTLEKLSWRMAERNERKVAEAVYEKREIDGIYNLDQSGLLDGFYEWMEEWGVIQMLERINFEGVQRIMVPVFQFVILYFVKTLFGIEAMGSLPRRLFANHGAMKLAGFNAHQIENGVCKRGQHRRKHKGKTGPICDDALVRNIVKIPLKGIEQFFNGIVKLLARKGCFPKYISVIIDPTDIRTTSKWEGCGTVTRPKRVKDKHGKWQEIEIKVWGWKLIVVFYAPTKIPLAAKLLKIQESENNYTIELIKKAQKNLGKYCTIKRIKMDRGHLDGKDLWWIKGKGYEFVIPSRGNMQITDHTRRLAEMIIKENGIPVSPGVKKAGVGHYIQVRENKVRRGTGKNQWTEKLRTVVIGMKGLTCYDQYGPEGFDKNKYKKSFRPNKINVVVVIEWDGKNYGRDHWVVYLTNMSVYKPLKVFDEYDQRSIIENSLFKEAKQGWFIKHAPQKTERALAIHIFFTLSVFTLTNVYRKWKQDRDREEAREEADDSILGIRRWREKTSMRVKDKCLVFIGNHYGTFWMAEVMTLSGIKVKDIPLKAGTKEDIFARYGLIAPG